MLDGFGLLRIEFGVEVYPDSPGPLEIVRNFDVQAYDERLGEGYPRWRSCVDWGVKNQAFRIECLIDAILGEGVASKMLDADAVPHQEWIDELNAQADTEA